MVSVKKSIFRYFALPVKQLFLFVAKLTILSILVLLVVYQGISYYHTRFFNRLKEHIVKQKNGLKIMIDQKNLEHECDMIVLGTDLLRLNIKKWQQKTSELHHYAKEVGVLILSYQGEGGEKNKKKKKELQSYTIQGKLDDFKRFLGLLIQEQYPAHCVMLKLLRQQEKNYVLHITLKKYVDYETKPLQPGKQAEGLGGE